MNLSRWLAPLALLHALACSSSVDRPVEDDASSGGATAASGTTGAGAATGASTSTSSGAGGAPPSVSGGTGGATVECSLGEGAPPGAPCALEDEGDICDFAGSGCWVTCTDGVWVEGCTECPPEAPEQGTDCADYYGVGPCTYALDCGDLTATCDGPTGLWVVDTQDCG